MNWLALPTCVAAGILGLLLTLPVLAVVLPLWVFAGCVRVLARLLQPAAVHWSELFDFDRTLGWRLRPANSAMVLDLNGDAFHVTTADSGWRTLVAPAEAEIVVLGDSFAFGYGIDERHFFSHKVRGLNVATLGVPGYNLVQSLFVLRNLAQAIVGKTVVWLVYHGNDLDDNLIPHMDSYRMPFVCKSGDRFEYVTSHLRPDPWPFPNKRNNIKSYIEICSGTPRTRRAFDALEFLLAEAAQICADGEARLVVMSVPDLSAINQAAIQRHLAGIPDADRFDPSLPDHETACICDRLGIALVPLGNHLDQGDYLPHDVHWNARGHARFARLLETLALRGPAELARRPASAGS